jgi:guanylate kinase
MSTIGKLIIFSAPSGAGKTTIVREILKNENFRLEFSVSACSRPKRENETHGRDYYFLSVAEFKEKIAENAFVEWEEVYTDSFYGTLKSEVERIRSNGHNVIFDVDAAGGLNIKKQFTHDALSFFIMPPSIAELEKRLRLRNTDIEESIRKRLAKAEFEITFAEKFDRIILNDDLEKAVANTKNEIEKFLFI